MTKCVIIIIVLRTILISIGIVLMGQISWQTLAFSVQYFTVLSNEVVSQREKICVRSGTPTYSTEDMKTIIIFVYTTKMAYQ